MSDIDERKPVAFTTADSHSMMQQRIADRDATIATQAQRIAELESERQEHIDELNQHARDARADRQRLYVKRDAARQEAAMLRAALEKFEGIECSSQGCKLACADGSNCELPAFTEAALSAAIPPDAAASQRREAEAAVIEAARKLKTAFSDECSIWDSESESWSEDAQNQAHGLRAEAEDAVFAALAALDAAQPAPGGER